MKEFVDRRLVTIDADETVMEAARLLKKNNVRSIIVTKRQKPVGIITERDILYKVSTQDKPPSTSNVKEIMSSPLEGVTANTPISEALETMKKHNLRRLLVKEDSKPIGLVTQEAIIGDSVTSDVTTDKLKTPAKSK